MDKGNYCNSNRLYLHMGELAVRWAVELYIRPSECAKNLIIQYEYVHGLIIQLERRKKRKKYYYSNKKKDLLFIRKISAIREVQ